MIPLAKSTVHREGDARRRPAELVLEADAGNRPDLEPAEIDAILRVFGEPPRG